jgi:hypothetical protein
LKSTPPWYLQPVRFKNFSGSIITLPYQLWIPPKKTDGFLTVSVAVDAGEITEDFDPKDPIVQLMLKAHPELRPITLATAWERIQSGLFSEDDPIQSAARAARLPNEWP